MHLWTIDNFNDFKKQKWTMWLYWLNILEVLGFVQVQARTATTTMKIAGLLDQQIQDMCNCFTTALRRYSTHSWRHMLRQCDIFCLNITSHKCKSKHISIRLYHKVDWLVIDICDVIMLRWIIMQICKLCKYKTMFLCLISVYQYQRSLKVGSIWLATRRCIPQLQ